MDGGASRGLIARIEKFNSMKRSIKYIRFRNGSKERLTPAKNSSPLMNKFFEL